MTSPATEPNPSQAACYPVPFGHVPYTPALPHAMGPLWEVPVEWWYYAGWAMDESGSKRFSILIETLRISQGKPASVAILYGIGSISPGNIIDDAFLSHTSFGIGTGDFPFPTSTSWSLNAKTNIFATNEMSCKLTSGILGLPGATYQVTMDDKTNMVSVNLHLRDTHGMVLEEASGANNKAGGTDSFEFAMPSLSIQQGSIAIKGVTTQLTKGNIWLDRQTQGKSSLSGIAETVSTADNPKLITIKPMYTGNWFAITMDDRTQYMLAIFWPKMPTNKQWIVGSELEPPVYALSQFGLEYPSLPAWDGNYPSMGVKVLQPSEFNLNILYPKDPANSPNWQSKESGNIYCNAWKLRIRDTTYTVRVLIPGSEVWLGTFFFEGAADVIHDGVVVGKAFCEQMGYN